MKIRTNKIVSGSNRKMINKTDGSTDPQVGSKARRKGGEGGSGGKSDLKD